MALTKLNYTGQGTIPIAKIPIITSKLPTGSVIQTVSSQLQSSNTTPNASFADVNGTSISITPSSTSSKIYITWNCGGMANNTNNAIKFKIFRGSTEVRFIPRYGYSTNTNGSVWVPCPIAIQYLDSPSTASSVTYKLQCATQNDGDFRINDEPDAKDSMVVIAMEIKGP